MRHMAKFQKRAGRSRAGTAGITVLLLIIALIMALPFVYIVVQSLKPMEEIFIFPPRFWVKRPTLNNFRMLFGISSSFYVPFSRYAFNSIFVVLLTTAIQVIFASMAAYPLAKHRFRGRNLLFNLVVVGLLFTPQVTMLPQYIVLSYLGIIDTYAALILPSMAYPLGLYLMRQNLIAFPDSLLESARIDGAPERTIFWRVVMPVMKPVWMTIIVFSFGTLWNRSEANLIYTESLKGLPTMLQQISSSGLARMGVSAATSVILIIPPILIFLLTQSKVMETMASAGMKE